MEKIVIVNSNNLKESIKSGSSSKKISFHLKLFFNIESIVILKKTTIPLFSLFYFFKSKLSVK